MTKSYNRGAILRAAWSQARWIANLVGRPVRQFIGASMRKASAVAKEASPVVPVMVQQPVQQAQAKAALDPVDAIKIRIRELGADEDKNGAEIAGLFAKLPGVTSCEYDGWRYPIVATGTRCGSLNREYTLSFLFEAFCIPAFKRVNEQLDEAIKGKFEREARWGEMRKLDRFDHAVDRTIMKGAFSATVEPVDEGKIAVTVTAALKGGGAQYLGRVIMLPRSTRTEVVDEAVDRLGYGYLSLDMDADDGSEIPTQKRAALDRRLAHKR